jgi:uncharacterized protein
MPTSPDRAAHFPAIERKYGKPIAFWLEQIRDRSDHKYAEQMAFLQEEHGFSRAHANAVVLFCRGSTSARRFETLDDYLAPVDEVRSRTVRAIFHAVQRRHPGTEVVIAWNQPLLRWEGGYLFGVSVHQNHLLLAPFDAAVLPEFAPRLEGYILNKKTIRVPVDWTVDEDLISDMVAAQMGERRPKDPPILPQR